MKFLTSAKFLTCCCFSVILLLRIKKLCLVLRFLMCVGQIETFRLDVRYPQEAMAREEVHHWKFSDFVLDLNYFSFTHPNPTYLPNYEFISPNNQFYQRIWYVEYYSMHQRRPDSEFSLSDPILFLKNDIRFRSETCFCWNHTIGIRKLSESVLRCTTYIFVLCLFCLMRQNNCGSYFAFS